MADNEPANTPDDFEQLTPSQLARLWSRLAELHGTIEQLEDQLKRAEMVIHSARQLTRSSELIAAIMAADLKAMDLSISITAYDVDNANRTCNPPRRDDGQTAGASEKPPSSGCNFPERLENISPGTDRQVHLWVSDVARLLDSSTMPLRHRNEIALLVENELLAMNDISEN